MQLIKVLHESPTSLMMGGLLFTDGGLWLIDVSTATKDRIGGVEGEGWG